MSFNKIIIVGNLGRDPELRYTPQGQAVCNFSMATTEKRKAASGEMQDHTTWFRVTLWGKQAENASKYLQKGKAVYIEGRLRLEEYTDKEGKTRQTLDVNGSDMQFIGSRNDGEGGGGNSNRDYNQEESESAPRQQSRDFGGNSSSGGNFNRAAATQQRPNETDDFDAGASDEDIPF